MNIQEARKQRVKSSDKKLIAVFFALALSLSGCFLGMYMPASSSVELDDPNPLKSSVANVRTLAILTASTSGGVDTANALEKAELGNVTDPLSLYSPKIAEALQQNPRFHIITPYEVEKAVGVMARIEITPSMTEAEKARYRAEAILKAGRSVKADGVILIEGEKKLDMGLGTSMVGRVNTEYRVMMTVYATETGAVLWKQKATSSGSAGVASASEITKQIDPELVSALVQNFNATMR